ncbi:tyrosine-type recombinase/integrase [Roseicyclus persicicus]|uniref:Site-specific integrase n=1 Tax=Roseicyclus persicicus TaxID=2650661 RepID=A0A7X6JWS0_9RHOB|nr:site-specific integrase [Roseibacterium persicicum]NKX43995.1 site-specific integrase [Roseibacterium persicicum]
MTRQNRSVSDTAASWLKTCERNGLERSTIKTYASHLHVHILPRIGGLLVSDLTRSDIRDFMDGLLDDGVSRTMVRKVMVTLRSMLAEAVEREWVHHNVASDVRLKRGNGRDRKRVVIPTKDEIRTIMTKAPASHRTMFTVAIFTGMRISELRGLFWDAVDFDRRVIKIKRRADEFGQIGPPKSRAGERDIPMAPTVLDALAAWKKSGLTTDDGPVFPNAAGGIQNYNNLYNRVFRPMLIENGITDEAGAAKFGIHALRHAAASLFIEQGWNPKKIQTLLGHASINMTMDVYGHLFENLEEDVAMFEKLENDLFSAGAKQSDGCRSPEPSRPVVIGTDPIPPTDLASAATKV